MTAHAAALRKEVATEIQRLCSLRHTIFRVTLLAAGLGVLFFKHGPEPETMTPVTFYIARRRATVAPVTTGAAKLIRVMYLQNFSVGMADKRACQAVRFFAGSIRRQARRASSRAVRECRRDKLRSDRRC